MDRVESRLLAKLRTPGLPALAMFFIFASFPLLGQDAEPEEPGIILPPTLLEVEDLQVEEISAVIPEEDVQLLPEINIPLPQAEEIFLPEERFDIPYPDQLALTSTGVVRGQRPVNIFSEGEIAVGSMSHIRGDLTLYRLGPDPRFDLRFYHDKIDGYGLRSAGSGFYHSEDLLEGNVSYTSGKVDIHVHAGITESAEGLQQRGEYESLTHRRVFGEGGIEYPALENLLLKGSVRAGYDQQILASTDPQLSAELDLGAQAGIELTTRYIDFETMIGYTLLNPQTAFHNLELTLSPTIKVNEVLSFELAAGVSWIGLADFLFPFSARGLWYPSDSFALEVGGGYFVEFPSYADLRDEYRFTDLPDTPDAEYGWFAYADTQIRLLGSLFVAADVDFKYYDRVRQVNQDYSPVTGLFGFAPATEILSLQTGLGVSYSIERAFTLSLSWDGRFIGDHPFEPAHRLIAGMAYRQPEDTFGAALDVRVPLSQAYSHIPELTLSAFYRLSESVRLNLDLSDPLSPLIPEGRTYWAPYEAPGFHAYLGTNISL
ncbi:MAG: hypothetical protein JW852_05695 [Spirochaetales bacterium]|nr:hypothetical protein [Spirochaetales bacterium]